MVAAIGAVLGLFVVLCGAFLFTMLVFSPENDDFHFGKPQ